MEPPKKRQGFSKRTLTISGGVLLVVALAILAFLVPDVIRGLGGPQPMTMAQAADVAGSTSAYATIEDGTFVCDTISYVRGPSSTNRQRIVTRFTDVFRTDDSGRIVMLVRMSDEWDCPDLLAADLSGYLTRMDDGTRQDLTNEARLARFIKAEHFLEFCGYCGVGNSLIGIGMSSLIGLGGIALIAVARKLPDPVPGPAQAPPSPPLG